jgi:16S rRNA (cytidine1402-2'-O)-methyltransferase
LLHHFGISVKTISLHDHNEAARAPELVARIVAGSSVALVSDAGTPGVSDPGFKLVRAALDAGIRVEVIPGPSAVLAALTGSGLPTDAFVFVGFPPPKATARAEWFANLAAETRTIVMFEAPHRIRQSLEAALEALGDRRAAVGRELTKLHEEFLRGTLSSVLARLGETRGEFTVVLAGSDNSCVLDTTRQLTDKEVLDAFDAATASGLDRRGAIAAAAARCGLKPRAAYAAVERARAGHS